MIQALGFRLNVSVRVWQFVGLHLIPRILEVVHTI